MNCGLWPSVNVEENVLALPHAVCLGVSVCGRSGVRGPYLGLK